MTALACLRRGAQHFSKFQAGSEIFKSFQRLESSFVPKRVLVIKKVSRYQIEQIANPHLSTYQLKEKLVAAGANYDAILTAHCQNEATELRTVETLSKLNISHRIKTRYNIDIDTLRWADLILPIGGDGTFLMSSNLIGDNSKPIIGINSDPELSEGFLMLPTKYTNNIGEIFEKLKCGYFKYLMRSRVSITLHGDDIWQTPSHLHDKILPNNQERFYVTHHNLTKPKGDLPKSRKLPWLAVNEVFIGESLSARISVLHVDIKGKKIQKLKCSGMCITTGTGSSSWYRAINYLNPQTVDDVLSMAGCKKDYGHDSIRKICSDFNSQLSFPPDQEQLSYVIRDMIVKNVWPLADCIVPRGFCDKLSVRSMCPDGGLVIDGGIAVHFSSGTMAVFETLEQDALRNIVLLE